MIIPALSLTSFKKTLPLIFVSVITIAIAGCSQTPTSLILQPSLDSHSIPPQLSGFRLNVVDERAQPAIAFIHKDDQLTAKISASTPAQQLISNALTPAKNFNPVATKVLNVAITKLHSDVKQSSVSHEVANYIELTLTLNNQQQTFTKSYQGNSQYKGPLKYDIAVLEKELNMLISNVLTEALADEELQQQAGYMR
ncbi:YajG family lipoprotein [Flocculibacter collagenilyticus]|uniref:YajG family lipoprotein n=1 Tax=Flocculibacter collagenilyticus TaxID=2744479 RepID=UPI0018F4E736|nr:YajG family lipoprotein [Flocculibacter collagenilyticus]